MAIDANRKLEIDRIAVAAVAEKLAKAADHNRKQDSVSIFDDKMTAEEKQYAYEAYSREMLERYYDSDNDKKITVEEFAKVEMREIQKDKTGDAKTFQELEKFKAESERYGFLLAQNLDVNGDGTISVDEMNYFNKKIDITDKGDDHGDGKLTNAATAHIADMVYGVDADDKKVKEVTEKYLKGEDLTEEEQKILNGASTTIRTSMAKNAKEEFSMDLGTVKDQTVYRDNMPDASSTGSVFQPPASTMDPETAKKFISSFLGNFFNANSTMANSAIASAGGMGGGGYAMPGMGGMGGFGGGSSNMINFLNPSGNQGASQNGGANIGFKIGNLFGQGLNMLTFFRGVFGGGGFGGGIGNYI